MDILIRQARQEDLHGLHEVMKMISKGICFEKGADLIQKIADKDEQQLIVAVDKATGEIVGSLFALVFPDLCETGRPILLVENVAVLHKVHGHGIGRQLFDYIDAFAKEHDCHYSILVSGNARQGAHRFYEALGFLECKGYKKYYD